MQPNEHHYEKNRKLFDSVSSVGWMWAHYLVFLPATQPKEPEKAVPKGWT
jgi:hypothetical protein